MLQHQLTKWHAGLILWGDRSSLDMLYEFIFKVNEQSCYLDDKESFLLYFAGDVRHAKQGSRKKSHSYIDTDDQCLVYGVEQLWPMLLTQVAVLRHAMAFMSTDKNDQAVMFGLEALIELALRNAIPASADQVLSSMERIANLPFEHISDAIYSRCQYFVGLKGKKRLLELPAVMQSLDPMYHFWGERALDPAPGYLRPSVFELDQEEWPDFRW